MQPAQPVAERIELLRSRGIRAVAIAARAGVSTFTIRHIQHGECDRVQADTYTAIMAIPVPQAPTGDALVDATGTRRRLEALACDDWPGYEIVEPLGYHRTCATLWRRSKKVTADAAAAVKLRYGQLEGQRGPVPYTGASARNKGWLPRRYWPADRIDSPRYNPFRTLAQPIGVRRMLRALTAIGHGLVDLARELDEPDPSTIEKWLLDGDVPTYARHLVDAVFDRLFWTPGDDVEAIDRALHLGWFTPAAWGGVDIHRPSSRPKPNAPRPRKDEVLPSAVHDALDGRLADKEIHALSIAERVTIVTILHRRGWSDQRIGVHLRWADTPKRAGELVTRFREWHNIGIVRRQQKPDAPRCVTSGARTVRLRALARAGRARNAREAAIPTTETGISNATTSDRSSDRHRHRFRRRHLHR